jgi:predicted phosphodiesterase
LWVLSDLHLEAVPHPEAFRPVRPAFDVLVVAGDVWQGDSRRALETVATLADGKPAVFVMGNYDSEAEVAGISFVGGTLWADGRLTRGVIEAAMARPRDGRLVVVTNRAPSDLSLLTDVGQAALWVHGHVHATIDVTRPGGTRIVCNAAGPGFTDLAFRDDWIIEL